MEKPWRWDSTPLIRTETKMIATRCLWGHFQWGNCFILDFFCRVVRLSFGLLRPETFALIHPRSHRTLQQVPLPFLSHPVPSGSSSDHTSPIPSFSKHSLTVPSLLVTFPQLLLATSPVLCSFVQTIPQSQSLDSICSFRVNWVPPDEVLCGHGDFYLSTKMP